MVDVVRYRAGVLWLRDPPRPPRRGQVQLSRARSAGLRAWQDEDLPGRDPAAQRAREWQVIAERVLAPHPPGDRPPTLVVLHRHAWTAHRVPALLSDGGVVVHVEASDAARAIGVIVAEQPDGVLLSEELPGQSSLEVAERIRRLSPLSCVAVHVNSQSSAQDFHAVADAIYSRWCDLATIASSLRDLLPE